MAKLIYSAISSLDGYVADEEGNFDWAVPDEEVHAFINDLDRAGRHLPLRAPNVRDDGRLGDRPHTRRPVAPDAGLRPDLASRRQNRVLQDASGRIYRQDAERARVRPRSGQADEVPGWPRPHRGRSRTRRPGVRGRFIDECHLFVAPMVVGGGKRSLPDNLRLRLELLDERRFESGMVYLFYHTRMTR
jgi:hypothetical protein